MEELSLELATIKLLDGDKTIEVGLLPALNPIDTAPREDPIFPPVTAKASIFWVPRYITYKTLFANAKLVGVVPIVDALLLKRVRPPVLLDIANDETELLAAFTTNKVDLSELTMMLLSLTSASGPTLFP